MSPEQEPRLSPRMRDAIGDLKTIVRARYPDATFRVRRNPEDTRSIDLVTTVDVEDRDEVIDIVLDRVLTLQLEDRLPIHVVPIRPHARTLAMLRAQSAAEQYAPVAPPTL